MSFGSPYILAAHHSHTPWAPPDLHQRTSEPTGSISCRHAFHIPQVFRPPCIRAPPMRASSPHTFPHPNADLPIRSRRSHIPFGGSRISPYHGATLHTNARSPIGPASSTKSHTVPAETSGRFTQTCASNRLTQIPCNKGVALAMRRARYHLAWARPRFRHNTRPSARPLTGANPPRPATGSPRFPATGGLASASRRRRRHGGPLHVMVGPEGRPRSCGPPRGGQLRGGTCVSFPGVCRTAASGLR